MLNWAGDTLASQPADLRDLAIVQDLTDSWLTGNASTPIYSTTLPPTQSPPTQLPTRPPHIHSSPSCSLSVAHTCPTQSSLKPSDYTTRPRVPCPGRALLALCLACAPLARRQPVSEEIAEQWKRLLSTDEGSPTASIFHSSTLMCQFCDNYIVKFKLLKFH